MKKYFAEIIICLLIIAAGLVIYARLGHYGYILYDDMLSIYDPFYTGGLSLKKIGQAFYKPSGHLPYQVPIPVVVRLALWELFGGDPGKHHLFSLCLHLTVSLLLFLFLRAATKKTGTSSFCALLFTVHPINVELVSWLAGFNGMLEAFFLMTALVCYAYYVRKPSWKRYLLIFPPFILGLLCKPTMAILPFLLFLLDYWPFRRFSLSRAGLREIVSGFRRNKIMAEKIPFVVLIPLQFIMGRLMITGRMWDARQLSLRLHPGSIVDFICHFKKVIYPAGLAIGRPDPPEASLLAATGLIGGLLLISFLLLWKARSRGHLITGWFWFLFASAPVMLMLFLSGRPVEDHHLYIPLIGIFIIISFGVPSFMSNVKYGRYLLSVAGIIVLATLTPLARLQVKHWENSITIFSHAAAVYPDNKKALVNLGDAYMEKNKINQAIHHYRRFLHISPDSALGHTKLANALAAADMADEAARYYKKAMELSPDYAPAYHGLADLLIRRGETDQAVTLYHMALKIDPALFQTHNNLALALYDQGRIKEAYDHLNQAISINPLYQTAVRNRRALIDALKNGGKHNGFAERSDSKSSKGLDAGGE